MDRCEREAASPEPRNLFQQRVQGAREEIDFFRQKARRLEEEVEAAKREMRGLDARSSELEDRDQDLEKMSKEMEPRTKHELSLYAHISNIKWDDYEDTGRVAGVLSKGHSRELKRFDYEAGGRRGKERRPGGSAGPREPQGQHEENVLVPVRPGVVRQVDEVVLRLPAPRREPSLEVHACSTVGREAMDRVGEDGALPTVVRGARW